jgi:hypothetical protein
MPRTHSHGDTVLGSGDPERRHARVKLPFMEVAVVANRNTEMNDPNRIKAEILAAMWEHSEINPDGFREDISRADRRKRRADLHDDIDALLDEFATSTMLINLADYRQPAE